MASVEELQRQIEFILGATKTGLDIIDSNYNLVYVDPEWAKAYGDYRGKKCYVYFMGKRAACPGCGVKKALRTKKSVVTEEILKKENNRPIQVTTIPFQDERGRWLVAEVNVDIAERKAAESALRESEKKFRAIFDNANDGMILTDLKTGKLSMANKGICRMLGYRQEEMEGFDVTDLHPKEELAYVKEQMAGQVKDAFMPARDLPMLRKNKSVFYASVRGCQLRLHGKNYLMGIFRDISERKKAEGSLKDSEERYRVLYGSSRDAIMTLMPPDWVFTAGNPATIELFGAKNEKEFTSMAPWELSPKYQPDGEYSSVKARRMINAAMKDGSRFFEWTHKRIGGKPFAATVLLTRIEIKGEVFLQATVRDISELKKAEEDLFRAKRLSDIGTLAATVAHELRNPLATMRTAIFNIKRKSRDPLIEGHLENMEKKIVESSRIINDLLFYSRIRLPKFEPVKLCAIMEECVGLSQERFKGYRVKLHRVCKIAKGTVIQADIVQLKELCHNILDNAYESLANKRGAIEVKVSPAHRSGFITISVKDNGVGISAESLKRILEPFFTTKVRGTGLGFSICNQIVRLHNGTMNVASKEGKGTTVTVTLPVSQRKP